MKETTEKYSKLNRRNKYSIFVENCQLMKKKSALKMKRNNRKYPSNNGF